MGEKSDSNKFVVFDLGDWSKPATVLAERCADAIGGAFKPFQIVRVAKAEARAEEIRARMQIKIDNVQRRATARFIAEETRKQINMENIIRGAIPALGEAARPAEMESDWIANFFDKCRLVSDEQMQTIWSSILANEANNPGHFSKRTVNLVGSLEKFEAELFSALCRYVFVSPEGDLTPLFLQFQDAIYRQNKLTFGSLHHLADIGLIQFTALAYTMNLPKRTVGYSYCGLSRLVPVEPVAGFVDYVAEFWKKYGVTLSSAAGA
jgi:hypothetical protein